MKSIVTDVKKVGNYVFNPETDIIGQGAFATVYKATDLGNDSQTVALKVIPNHVLIHSEEQYVRIMRELQILQQITGPNIVQLLDSKRTTNNLYLITEYCNGGDLESYLEKHKSLSEEESLSILKQLTSAFISLQDVEGATIMHRDIKPANILFNDGIVKIADFGFAKMVSDTSKDVKDKHTLLGTPYYMNPQTLGDEEYSTKCDIWSAGFVLYECIFGHTPWTGTTIPGLLDNIKNTPLIFPEDKPISEETKDLIQGMLKFNEENRLDWESVWSHPALLKTKLPELDRKRSIKIMHKDSSNMSKSPKQGSPRANITRTGNAKMCIAPSFQPLMGDGKIKCPQVIYLTQQHTVTNDHKETEKRITFPSSSLQDRNYFLNVIMNLLNL